MKPVSKAQQLISDNTQKLRGLEVQLPLRRQMSGLKLKKARRKDFVVLVNKRDDLSLADRLLRKIDDENRQIKAEIPVRVVHCQILGHPLQRNGIPQ